MQKSKHNVHWSLDKGSKKTWSCTEQKMKAKFPIYSTSIEIMSKERFFFFKFFIFPSPLFFCMCVKGSIAVHCM